MSKNRLVPATLIQKRVSFVFLVFSHTVLDGLQLRLRMPRGAPRRRGAQFL
jgi:hypothetical protein